MTVCEVCDSPREISPVDELKERLKEKYSDAAYKSFIRYHYELLESADKGDTSTQYRVAEWFNRGGSSESSNDYSKIAVSWYQKAAMKGHIDAQLKLASCYEEGRGVHQNKDEAIKWYKKAASEGDEKALQKYLKLKYCSKVYESVIRYRIGLLSAADAGDHYSQYQLGEWFSNHNTQSAYREEAVAWYTKAAKGGHKDACIKLGESYLYGKMVTKDVAEAVKWYDKVGNDISGTDLRTIGYAYDFGNGVQMDKSKAVYYYRKAAEKGDAEAQYKLGLCYENGIGVTTNINTAKYWYKKAASQGHRQAQQCLYRITPPPPPPPPPPPKTNILIVLIVGLIYGVLVFVFLADPKSVVHIPLLGSDYFPTNLIIFAVAGSVIAYILKKIDDGDS